MPRRIGCCFWLCRIGIGVCAAFAIIIVECIFERRPEYSSINRDTLL
jgi:hypothetical protein